MKIALAVLLLALLLVSTAQAQVPSPENTRVPPATQIIDAQGAIWTLSPSVEYPGFFETWRNGQIYFGGIGDLYAFCGNSVYVRGLTGTWYRADPGGWSGLSTDDPCAPPPPPPLGVEPDYNVDITYTINWQDNSNPPDDEEDEFWIFRNMETNPLSGQPCGPNICRVGVVGRNVTTFVDHVTKIFRGQDSVCYQVLASNAAGLSPKSEPVCAPTRIIWQPETKAPNAPQLTTVE